MKQNLHFVAFEYECRCLCSTLLAPANAATFSSRKAQTKLCGKCLFTIIKKVNNIWLGNSAKIFYELNI
jgi:hypothetical protein